jgi:hypothetical protein
MRIEIVEGEDNPVAEFFSSPPGTTVMFNASSSSTPETDRLAEGFKRDTLPDDVKLDILFSYTRKLEKGFAETLKIGNKLAYECEKVLGLGLHQNTIERFKSALSKWRENT